MTAVTQFFLGDIRKTVIHGTSNEEDSKEQFQELLRSSDVGKINEQVWPIVNVYMESPRLNDQRMKVVFTIQTDHKQVDIDFLVPEHWVAEVVE